MVSTLLLFAALGNPALGQDEESPVSSSAKAAELATKIWWNQADMIEALGLTTDFRGQADAALEEHVESSRSRKETATSAQERFLATLEGGDLSEAQPILDEISGLNGWRSVSQARLKVTVLNLLEDDQLAKLRTDYPHLLKQSWIRRQRFGGQQRGPAMRERSRRNPGGGKP